MRICSASMILVLSWVLSLAVVPDANGEGPQAATGNVVTLSFTAAVLQTAEAQKQLAALQSKFASREAHLKTLNGEVEELRKGLQAGDKLSDAERAKREQALNNKAKQLQRDEEDFRNDSQSESQQIFQAVAQKVYTFLQAYAQQHGYAMVVERGSDASPVVWYAAGDVDITGDVAKAYDAQSGAASPSGNRPAAQVPSAPKRQPDSSPK